MRKFMLKKDGKYWSRLSLGSAAGFCAPSVNTAYTFMLWEIKELQRINGGEIVEVVSERGSLWSKEVPYVEKGMTVKLAKPEPGEEDLRFIVQDYFEPRAGLAARVQLQFVCDDMPIKPVSTIAAEEVIPV